MDVLRILYQLPDDKRNNVESVTMDLSDSMRAIARSAFPKATAIRDCFHVVRRGGEACEEIQLEHTYTNIINKFGSLPYYHYFCS